MKLMVNEKEVKQAVIYWLQEFQGMRGFTEKDLTIICRDDGQYDDVQIVFEGISVEMLKKV